MAMIESSSDDRAPLRRFAETYVALRANVEEAVRGKRPVVDLALLCMIADGHLLIEDVPGVGKTLLAKSIAASIDGTWKRVQFTPDLLPTDVVGVSIFERATNQFRFRPGAVFANLVLCDEINRASPKTQSALLEAMEERQVTIDGTTHPLPRPCMVIATQNPVEHEGTFPLPESQLDRFLIRTSLGYPDRAAEIAILETHGNDRAVAALTPVASTADIAAMVAIAGRIHVASSLRGYLVDIANASRIHPDIRLGASPRATLGLLRSARARAAASGREYVVPDDIQSLAPFVLAHRLLLHQDALRRGVKQSDVVAEIVSSVAVPVRRA